MSGLAWLLADAAQQNICEQDSKRFHVKISFQYQFHSMLREYQANTLLEREQTLVDALLLRFRNITELAQLASGNEVKEVTAAQTFQLKVETAGLIRAAEDLMSLTRELKEMWLFGPLRKLNEGDANADRKIEGDARAVAILLDKLTKKSEGQKQTPGEAKEKSHAALDEEDDDDNG